MQRERNSVRARPQAPFWPFILLAVGACSLTTHPSEAGDPVRNASAWLESVQNPDGSFGTGDYLPRELQTALVLTALSEAGERADFLNRAAGYLIRSQGEDGCARIAGCVDSRMPTSLVVLALTAYRDLLRGTIDRRGTRTGVLDPRDLHEYFASGAARKVPWDEFDPDDRSPEVANDPRRTRSWIDLHYAAMVTRPADVRWKIEEGQRADGAWADGGDVDRTVVATAFMVRTLRFLDARGGEKARGNEPE